MLSESMVLMGLFVGGASAGAFSRWGPLSGWAALAFPLVLPALGVWFCALFC